MVHVSPLRNNLLNRRAAGRCGSAIPHGSINMLPYFLADGVLFNATKVLDVPKMKGLITLPYEVLSNIVSNVDFDDIASLGRSCKFFQYLHTEESICKYILQVRHRRVLVICLHNVVRYRIFQLADGDPRRRSLSLMKRAWLQQQDMVMRRHSEVRPKDGRPLPQLRRL